MKGLQTLVRARQRALDDRRRALTALQDQSGERQQARVALADERASEAQAVLASADGGYGFGNYLIAARRRDAALVQEIAALEQRIEAARDEIATAFAEIKRYELIDAAQAERARKEAARRDQDEMNELGLNVFRRGEAAGP